jgi:DNA-binding Lrp family transcriptional regulator
MIRLPDFIIIPYQLLDDERISLIDERLYGIIYWLTKLKNEQCIASNKTLADLVKTTSGTIQNSLTKLESLGYIKRIYKDREKKVRKEIIVLVAFSRVSPTSDTRVSLTDDTVSLSSDTRVSLSSDQNKNIYNKKSIIRNSEETSLAKDIAELIDLFKEVNPSYKKFFGNKTQRGASERLLKTHGMEKLKKIIELLAVSNNTEYMPVVTTPLQLEDKFGQLATAWQKKKNREEDYQISFL